MVVKRSTGNGASAAPIGSIGGGGDDDDEWRGGGSGECRECVSEGNEVVLMAATDEALAAAAAKLNICGGDAACGIVG